MLSGNVLAFTAVPTTTNAGAIIDSPAGVQVTVENSSGQPVTSDIDSITISIGSNPGGATLGGTVTAAAVGGVATFNNLWIGAPSNGYTLVATDTSFTAVTPATSSAFNIDALPLFDPLVSMTHGVAGAYNPNSLVSDNAGHLFGTTVDGGLYGDGSVFELSGVGYSTMTTLLSFTGALGAYPGIGPDALMLDSSGNLYGTTEGGGLAPYGTSEGTVFELSGANHSTYTTVAEFTGNSGATPGADPLGNLAMDSSGNLFGTTQSGGSYGDGTVYEISPANHYAFSILTAFTGSTGASPGASPYGGLVLDGAGNLYGTTNLGGSAYGGTVFELPAPGHNSLTTLLAFSSSVNSPSDAGPEAGLAIDSSGNLYGTTYADGTSNDGNVFELSGTNHATYKSLVSFTGAGGFPGSWPNDQLIMDGAGNLYGTTYGGANGYGTVYELSGSNHATFKSLVGFTGQTGADPGTSPWALTIDASGNLFGTTYNGGADLSGTVFELPGSHPASISTLFTFNGGAGASPQGESLVRDSSGNLYGVTPAGGLCNDGTVFELSGANDSIYTTLISFTGTSGACPGDIPVGTLAFDASGNLFGVTYQGGPTGDGTVYELSGAGHQAFTSLVSFATAGTYPDAGLTFDSSGNLYGTTSSGGTYYDGTVFELSAGNYSGYTTLVSFSGTAGATPGANPQAALTYDKTTGNLYGTTEGGGAANDGTVFQLAGANLIFSSLVSFTGTSGADVGRQPYAGVYVDGSGNLLGTTKTGGTAGDGNVFELTGVAHATFASLLSFTGHTGTDPGLYPVAPLVADASGNLYGTTQFGGTSGSGTVFKLAAGTHAFTSMLALTGSGGNDPGGDISGGLVIDHAGNLFGACLGGGAYGLGTIFEIAIDGSTSLAASGNLTIAPPPGTGSPGEYFSNLVINTAADLVVSPASPSPTVVTATGLTISGTTGNWAGTLDVANNDLDLTGGSLDAVTNQVRQGYNAGKWTGLGITSSNAATDSSHLTALGVIQNNQSGTALFSSTYPLDGITPGASDILVKYTYYGDANLDGKVDGSDYSLIDNGYLNHRTGWFNGDFNYDGVVNGSDYTLIDNSFNRQGSSLASQVATPRAQVATKNSVKARAAAMFSQMPITAQTAALTAGSPLAPDSVAAGIFGDGDIQPRRMRMKIPL